MKKLILLLCYTAYAFGQVSVTSAIPAFGWAVLAGSVRNIGFQITNGTGNLLNYSVSSTTGGATASLGCTSNCIPVVTVTIGSTQGNCSIGGSIGGYTVSSTASVTVTATSVDDGTKTFAVPINVCANSTQIFVIPFYRTLYAGQPANLQSFIVGSTDLNVTWSITSQPGGGDGTLIDTSNRDTVFTATVAGRYTVHCVSVADGTVSQDVFMYVTGNVMPYNVTPNLTEPVDPTVDPALTGVTYDVCASGTCSGANVVTTLGAVAVNVAGSFPSGSTIRLHNEDMSGSNPTVYFEYFEIGQSKTGSVNQPLRFVGVPDSLGNLPILDGNGAVGRSTISTAACAGLSIICVWPGGSSGLYQGGPNKANYIIVEGIHVRNARNTFKYTPPAGGAQVAYGNSATGLRVSGGYNVEVIGNDSDNIGDGTFSDSNTNANGWQGSVLAALWEGNHIHNFGVSGNAGIHGLYIQDILHVVQFNRVDSPVPGMLGSCLKTRTVGDVIRYNYIESYISSGGGCQRMIDFVEIQDNSAYVVFGQGSGGSNQGYLGYTGNTTCATSYWCLGDTMGANVLIAWQEVLANTHFYGNIENNISSGSISSHHYAGDQGTSTLANRNGTLNYYNNTFWVHNITGGFGQYQKLIDTASSGGNPYNFQNANIQNNIYWGDSSVSFPLFTYMNSEAMILATLTTNVLANANQISYTAPLNGGSATGHTGNGWANSTESYAYTLSIPLNTHLTGLSSGNFNYQATQPFNSSTFLPINPQTGTALTGSTTTMPVRFQLDPNTQIVTVRSVPVTGSTGGIIGARDLPPVPVITSSCPPSPTPINQVYSFTTTALGDPPITFAVTGRPHGVTFDTGTGVWGGTPDLLSTTSFLITAANNNGTSSPQSCSITVVSGESAGHSSGGGITPGGE